VVSAFPHPIQRQVDELAHEYGEPLIRIVAINSTAFWNRSTSNRTQEVCMVVRRPSGRILTARKTFYPPDAYRLLTGGIEPGESVLAALRREVLEETGLEVEIRRLLAVVGYRPDDVPDVEPRFWTFAFLLDEIGGTLGALDPHEQVAGFRDIEVEHLPAIADALDRLRDRYSDALGERWAPWGRFRAVIHRLSFEAMVE
jgi:8-oxo-dGTP pyrophosphatase MutT (NUDIX family)